VLYRGGDVRDRKFRRDPDQSRHCGILSTCGLTGPHNSAAERAGAAPVSRHSPHVKL
jgi:hypothetical protein